jgi:hypothetical protein
MDYTTAVTTYDQNATAVPWRKRPQQRTTNERLDMMTLSWVFSIALSFYRSIRFVTILPIRWRRRGSSDPCGSESALFHPPPSSSSIPRLFVRSFVRSVCFGAGSALVCSGIQRHLLPHLRISSLSRPFHLCSFPHTSIHSYRRDSTACRKGSAAVIFHGR